MNNKKSILVTGNNGFIGSYFVKKYSEDYNIIGIDITKSLQGEKKSIHYVGDVCDKQLIDSIFDKYKIDIIIHTAAEKSLIFCETNKKKAYDVNYVATLYLAQQAQNHNAKFIFISSDQVFDGNTALSTECSTVSPINYYGKLKSLVESELLKSHKSVAICRTALVFGDIPEEQRKYFDSVKAYETLTVQGFIVQQTKYCLENGLKILLPDDEFVSPTHVNLLSEQLNSVIINNASGILHCCGNDRISRYQMGLVIADYYNLNDSGILPKGADNPLRPKDVSLSCCETEKKLHMNFPNFKSMLHTYM